MNTYLVLKSLHLIAVISWMAGLLYLPRIFVYHVENKNNKSISNVFKIMERKLFWGIMTPSAVLTVIFGALLFSINFQLYMQSGWMHAKLLCVFLLLIYHIMCWQFLTTFKANKNIRSHKFYRLFNEVPVILLLAIIIFVVVKPL